jgi:hypothetical protein
MRRLGSIFLLAFGLCGGAWPAAAQTTRAPFTGIGTLNLGGAGGGDRPAGSFAVGGSIAVDEITGWGAELDFGFVDGAEGGADARAQVQSYLLNLHYSWPEGRIRPFAIAGMGALRVQRCGVECTAPINFWDWAYSAGAGARYVVNNWLGVGGDVRYFSTLTAHPDPARQGRYGFWRVAGGVSLYWEIVP